MKVEQPVKIPLHVGLIMDGNGRWAKKRRMPRSFGHGAGMNAMIRLAEVASPFIRFLRKIFHVRRTSSKGFITFSGVISLPT